MASFGAVRNDREPLSNPYQTHDLCPIDLCPALDFPGDYVCGGPGPAKDLPKGVSIDPNLVSEYRTGSHSYTPWPRLVNGERYLSVSPAEPTNGSICVVGGGPTAAWCVEHSQARGNTILWLSRDSLNSAFVSSRRNDSLVAGRIRRPLVNGEHTVEGPLKPRNATTIFAEGFEPSTLGVLSNNKVRVYFQPITGAKSRYVNLHGRQAYPSFRDFDQVVYSIGQITDPLDPRSWANLLVPVLKGAIARKKHLIRDRNHRVVGLQSEDSRVRVLGAAALSHPDLQPQWSMSGTSPPAEVCCETAASGWWVYTRFDANREL